MKFCSLCVLSTTGLILFDKAMGFVPQHPSTIHSNTIATGDDSVSATKQVIVNHNGGLSHSSMAAPVHGSSCREKTILYAKDEEKGEKSKGIIGDFFDMFANLDDVAEDFFYKRMGKGEIFYGKRKYKPSGDVEGEYNGFGLSDKLKIDMTREYKEAWLEEKRMRDEMRMIREEKEKRDASR